MKGKTHGKVARLSAVIAAAASARATQAERRAVGLNVAQTLAVIALLRVSGARKGAAIGLVAWQVTKFPLVIRFERRVGCCASYLAACLY